MRIAINEKQKYFSLPDHQLAENLLFLDCKKGQKENKSKFVTKSVEVTAEIIFM